MTTKNYNKMLFAGCIGTVLAFFALNIYTPLVADDFSLSFGIYSITDIFRFQYHMYFNWGGRNIAHFFAQFWLLTGKPLFNIANTAVYCVFILLVQFHITGTFKKFNPLVFLTLNVAFWVFVPVWGQNFLWLTGSANYLWTTTIILFFLVPFRKAFDNPEYQLKTPFSVLFLFLGILAGWCNENSGAAVLFLLISYFVCKIIRKEKLAPFEILGAVGFLAGFAIMIAAPGNFARMAVIEEYFDIPRSPGLLAYIQRFVSITRLFIANYGLFFLAISIFLGFDLIYHKKQKLHLFSYFYGLVVLAGTYSMLLSPFFPERAFFIVTVFMVITLGNVLVQSNLKVPDIVKRNPLWFVIPILAIISFNFLDTTREIVGTYLRWQDRIELIFMEKEKGNIDIVVNPIHAQNRHTAAWGLGDVSLDEDNWVSISVARYFGLNSIRTNDEPQRPLREGDMRKRIRQMLVAPWNDMGLRQRR